MIAYQFYLAGETNRNEFIGTLPERRINPKRINKDSIMNWAKTVFSGLVDVNHIYFVQETL
jgi:hypothetical protein